LRDLREARAQFRIHSAFAIRIHVEVVVREPGCEFDAARIQGGASRSTGNRLRAVRKARSQRGRHNRESDHTIALVRIRDIARKVMSPKHATPGNCAGPSRNNEELL
jgi:hypothetical protein